MMRAAVPHLRRAAYCIALVFFSLTSVLAFVPMRCGTLGRQLLWPSSKFPIELRVNTFFAEAPNLARGSDPSAALKAALEAWQSIPTSAIRFTEPQSTEIQSTFKDGVNVVTMVDTDVNRALLGGYDGAVAATRIEYDTLTGVISEADIVLNPRDTFSTNLAPNSYDLQSILTHELGHFLGCDHAVAQNDTMFFLTWSGDFIQRYLSADAVSFATSAYPDSSRIIGNGRITGKVTQGGKAVFGASVAAIDLDRNLLYTTLSEPDGSYSLTGPIAGRYAIYAEPLNGPVLPGDLLMDGSNAFYKNLNTSFRTVIREQQIASATEKISIRQLKTEVNFELPTAPDTLNIDRMGGGDPVTGAGNLALGPVVVSPGDELLLFIGGRGVARVDNIEDVRILGNGIKVDSARGVKVLRNGAGAEAGISVLIHVAPDAVPGARSVVVSADSEVAASTGGILVTARRPPVAKLYMPYLAVDPDNYTGLGIANPTSLPAVVKATARGEDGEITYEQDALVPRDVSVPARSQIARTAPQIFNFPLFTRQGGSVTLESDTADVQGFFLTGDSASTHLDGAEAFTRGYRELYFPDVLRNAATETEIHIMNVAGVPVTAVLELLGSEGRPLAPPQKRPVPAQGKIAGTIQELFGYGGELDSAHVRVSSQSECLVGFALFRQADAVWGLNGQPLENAAAVLYSPQLAVGDFGVPFSTRLNIVNVGASDTSVSVQLYGERGEVIADVNPGPPVELRRGAQMTIDIGAHFRLTGRGPVQGSIAITAGAGAKLIGNVVFGSGDPATERLGFAAALPLSGTGETRFLFSQVAQGQGFYTGVACLAPRGAELQVEVYRTDGSMAGRYVGVLSPGQRLISILEQLIPATAGQVGGYVRVSSSNPVISFEIFGATNGEFLSAVPPQRLVN